MAHRLRLNEERLGRGAPKGRRNLVFATGRGTPFEARSDTMKRW